MADLEYYSIIVNLLGNPEVCTMKDRIVVDNNVHFGKPCVAGTRIPVQNVLELVRDGVSFDTISRDYYPDLEVEDIRACIQHAIEVMAVEDLHIAPSMQ